MAAIWDQYRLFVFKLAQKYTGYAEIDDLTQEGYIGLNAAAWHYDTESGVPFLAYAAYWIRQAMQRYCENNAKLIRRPAHVVNMLTKAKRISRQYEQRFGKEPTPEEISALLGVSLQVYEAAKRSERVLYLDAPLEDGDTLADLTPDPAPDPYEQAERDIDRQNMAAELHAIIEELPADQRAVVIDRYVKGLSWADIERENGLKDAIGKWHRARQKLLKQRACVAYYEEYLAPASFRHVTLSRFRHTGTSQTERDALRNIRQQIDEQIARECRAWEMFKQMHA